MGIPSITMKVLSNGLGQLPASSAQVCTKLGICSAGKVNTLYPEADPTTAQQQLGVGPLVEAVCDTLTVAGGSVVAVPLNPSSAGSLGAVDTTGATGTGALTLSAAPAQPVDLKIYTGGALGAMAFQYRINGGAWSAPVPTSSGGPFSYLVPGTLTVVTFAAQTYTGGDVWTVSKLGGITVVGSGTAGWVTQVSSPLDAYALVFSIVTAGALGAGVFTVSADGGNSQIGGNILIPGGGAYAVPGTGVVVSFSAATYNVGSVYKAQATGAGFSTSDVTNAMAVVLADPTEFGFFHVVGQPSTAAGSASLAAVADTQAQNAFAAFRYIFGIVECPVTEGDAAVAAAYSNFVSDRVMVCAGDIGHISPINSRVIRRNCATVVTTRLSATQPKEHPGKVKSGALKNVKTIYRDEARTPYLDAQRFTTLRTWPKKAGYFTTRGNMMADSGSDFSSVMRRRVMDQALGFLYAALVEIVNDELAVDPKTGFIYEPVAAALERYIRNTIIAGLNGNVVDCTVTISRTEPILTTNNFPASVGLLPYGYAEYITGTIGFVNPALQQAA